MPAYKWWKTKHYKNTFSAPAKYLDFTTDMMEQYLNLRTIELQFDKVKRKYSKGFPDTAGDFKILQSCTGDYKIAKMVLYWVET